jgi:hypothetical protein
MNLVNTLKTNARDILIGLSVVLIVAFTSDVVNKLAITTNGFTWLSNLTAVLSGAARFFAANLIGWIGLAVAWPTLNHFSNHSFSDAWSALTDKERLFLLFGVACVLLISASICVSASAPGH